MTSRRGRSHRADPAEPPEDLSFGGWRDWLLVVLFGPIFVAVLVAAAITGIGSRSGPLGLSLPEALLVVALALAAGLLVHRAKRWWRDV